MVFGFVFLYETNGETAADERNGGVRQAAEFLKESREGRGEDGPLTTSAGRGEFAVGTYLRIIE